MNPIILKSMMAFSSFLVGATAAVSNELSTINEHVSPVQGYIRNSPFYCVSGKMCNNLGNIICKDGTLTMYGKDSSAGDCVLLLTHMP